ncbi:hypothetical protein [Sporolactobacillus sp. KGMB 08714]|uniref:hypothetical protein n=1 Tax=Sporolactobacillus sp. KGMB 08714 TaxID=3064704 RepID=UPI002FBDCDA0
MRKWQSVAVLLVSMLLFNVTLLLEATHPINSYANSYRNNSIWISVGIMAFFYLIFLLLTPFKNRTISIVLGVFHLLMFTIFIAPFITAINSYPANPFTLLALPVSFIGLIASFYWGYKLIRFGIK